jgi:tetratricopeptide (TPR) repeat protein
VLGDDDPETLRTLNNMGVVCAYQSRMQEAEQHWRELVERRRRVQGLDHPDFRSSLGNLGALLFDQGKTAEARPLIEEALASDRRHFGNFHSHTLVTMTQLAQLLHSVGEWEEAERLMKECVAGRRQTFGSESGSTLRAEAALAMIVLDRGDSVAAEMQLQKALALQRNTLGEQHPDTIQSIAFLALLKQKIGDWGKAIELSTEAVQRAREIQLEGELSLGELLSQHGELLLKSLVALEKESCSQPQAHGVPKMPEGNLTDPGLPKEIAEILKEGFDRLNGSLGADHPQTRRAALRLASFFEHAHPREPAAGHDIAASSWREKGSSN